VFKFRKEDKKRLTEEAANLSKKLKDSEITLVTYSLIKQMISESIPNIPTTPISHEPKFIIYVPADRDSTCTLKADWAPFHPVGRPVPRRGLSIIETMEREQKLETFEREKQAFLEVKDSLLDNPEFRGKFVAIYEGNIVDQDEDNRELAKRVYRRHGYVPIYIGKIERERRIIEMPSPEG